jgi:hypothetical protein
MEQRADERAEPAHPGLPALVGLRVVGRELADLLAPPGRVVRQSEIAAVAARREIRTLRVDVVAVLGEPQIADHRAVEPAHHV